MTYQGSHYLYFALQNIVMRKLLAILLLLLPELALAQTSISGTVRDSLTQQPLAFASVFLATITLGVMTNEQGHFEFARVPAGSYDLVASYVGYRLTKQALTVGTAPQQLILRLAPTTQLDEVVVRTARRRPNRSADYQRFVALFLGRTTFSRQCRIQNPTDVLVDFDERTNELTALATRYVQVDNQALGYRIRYYGLRFKANFTRDVLSFYGQPAFEEMAPRNTRQQQYWATNRARTYHGSLAHFLKSVHDNRVTAEGFAARQLRIVPNPRWPLTDSLRRALLRPTTPRAFTTAEQNSLAHWAKVPRAFSLLYTAARPIDSLRRMADGGQPVFYIFATICRLHTCAPAQTQFTVWPSSLTSRRPRPQQPTDRSRN